MYKIFFLIILLRLRIARIMYALIFFFFFALNTFDFFSVKTFVFDRVKKKEKIKWAKTRSLQNTTIYQTREYFKRFFKRYCTSFVVALGDSKLSVRLWSAMIIVMFTCALIAKQLL